MSDYGSWSLVSRHRAPYREGYIETWCGLSSDLDKLPHTGETGSRAYCVDTGNSYVFEKTTDMWYKQASCSASSGSSPSVEADPYRGTYEVIPRAYVPQMLPTAQKVLSKNVTVTAIPYAETSNIFNGTTITIAS